MHLILTVKPIKKENKEDIKQEDVSEKCPYTYPVPVSINKDPTILQDFNSNSIIKSRDMLRNKKISLRIFA